MLMGKLIKVIQFYFKTCDSLTLIEKLMKAIQFYFKPYGTLTLIRKLIKAIQFYCKTYENLTMIWNLSKLFSSIPKHMRILRSGTDQSYRGSFQSIGQSYDDWECYQSYSVLFQSIWQSYVDPKLIKAIQLYSKTCDNLTLIRNISKLFSSILKHMTILRWSRTYQSYTVLFQNIWQSYIDWKLSNTIQFYSKTYDDVTLIRKLIKAIQFYFKTYDNLTLIKNLSKLFSSIPKHMRISCWSETYQSYSVVFQNIWQSYINRKRVKAIQFYSKTYDNLTLIGNLSKLFSSIPKHIIILHLLETSQSDTVLFQQMWESYINWERIKATLVHSKAYDSLRMIGKLMKAIQFYFKTYNNLTLSRNLAKLFSPIPKDMTNLCLTETYQSYSVLFQNIRQSYVDQETYQSYTVPFQNIWQSYIDQKLIKTIQFYSKAYENLMLIWNLSKLFSCIPKYMTILH